jgi:hypothetical protein
MKPRIIEEEDHVLVEDTDEAHTTEESTHQQKYLLHPGIGCVATIFTRNTCYVKTPNIQALRKPLATTPAHRPNIQDVHKHH